MRGHGQSGRRRDGTVIVIVQTQFFGGYSQVFREQLGCLVELLIELHVLAFGAITVAFTVTVLITIIIFVQEGNRPFTMNRGHEALETG